MRLGLKDGVEIEKSSRFDKSIVDGLCKLVIKSLKRDDAGTFTCLAQNIHGGDRTKCTAVKSADELPLPPEFVKPLRDKTVIEGEDVILEVKIVGKPMPEVCWFMNEDEIEPSDRIQGRIECVADEIVFRLYIKNARLTDSNLYRCTASNIHGRASTQGKLTVEILKPAEQSPPRFVIPIVDASAVESKSAIFDVKVRGRPTPELIW
uniref:Ig-like domain-containing protein n=1 Tax=Romanomermis culicivorax TaxID=13658 RepID=A0A915I7E7_ROMCU